MEKPQTHMRKGRDGWTAKTEIPLEGITREDHTGTCPAILSINTSKASRGGLQTTVSVAFQSGAFMSHRLYEDFSGRFAAEPTARCTEKAIERMHDAALAKLDSIVDSARRHYGAAE